MELDDELCLCFHVTKRKVINFLRIAKLKRPSQLSECYGAGTGCGWCRPYLWRLFDEASAQIASQANPSTPAGPPPVRSRLPRVSKSRYTAAKVVCSTGRLGSMRRIEIDMLRFVAG